MGDVIAKLPKAKDYLMWSLGNNPQSRHVHSPINILLLVYSPLLVMKVRM